MPLGPAHLEELHPPHTPGSWAQQAWISGTRPSGRLDAAAAAGSSGRATPRATRTRRTGVVMPKKGRVPVTSSFSRTPKLYTSTCVTCVVHAHPGCSMQCLSHEVIHTIARLEVIHTIQK
eukprot:1146926-Pelagomonas_calceolata.AAC.1